MTISLERALGILPEAMRVREHRLELLSSNLANADTPGFKARDVDFRAELARVAEQRGLLRDAKAVRLEQTHCAHLDGSRQRPMQAPEVLYRVPSQPSLDGNTVDPQLEKAAFAENAIQFQSSLEFLNRRVSGIRAALRVE
ncbi:MAG: flagellar basal body rod protein FlgB [Thioalkalivibrionaceae bacterium]